MIDSVAHIVLRISGRQVQLETTGDLAARLRHLCVTPADYAQRRAALGSVCEGAVNLV